MNPIRKNVIQALIDGRGGYFIGNRLIEHRDTKNEWQTYFLSPTLDPKYFKKTVGELPYDEVEQIAYTELIANIHLAKDPYPPFQWGIRVRDFTEVTRVTCNANTLIAVCKNQEISDYYDVLKIMEEIRLKEEEADKAVKGV